ncbi:MAG: hypothetical protein P1V51_02785 [Deltaproteobacteria bacterium]|nr:hypothetical protein [Deltaproteobacteria bacterium]
MPKTLEEIYADLMNYSQERVASCETTPGDACEAARLEAERLAQAAAVLHPIPTNNEGE